jgi:two-component sensor histidine kinase
MSMADEIRTLDLGSPAMADRGHGGGMPGLALDDGRYVRALEADLARTRALLHEADHRAKNTLQVVTSLVLLQARRIGSTPAQRVLYAIAERISALSTVHRLLAEDEDGRFDVTAFLRETTDELRGASDRIAVALDLADADVAAAKAPTLALLVHELLAEAFGRDFAQGEGAQGERGHIAVSAAYHGGALRIVVADDGTDPAEPGDEFGPMLVDLLGKQLRAEVRREATMPGTRITITLPVEGAEPGGRR